MGRPWLQANSLLTGEPKWSVYEVKVPAIPGQGPNGGCEGFKWLVHYYLIMGSNCLNYQIVCGLQYGGLLVMFRQTAMTSVTASDICLTAALFTFYANTETCYLCHKGRGKTCGTWSWVSCHLQGKLTCSCMLSTFVSSSWSFSWLSCCFLALLGKKYSIFSCFYFKNFFLKASLSSCPCF